MDAILRWTLIPHLFCITAIVSAVVLDDGVDGLAIGGVLQNRVSRVELQGG